jgi:hypothetical protein
VNHGDKQSRPFCRCSRLYPSHAVVMRSVFKSEPPNAQELT